AGQLRGGQRRASSPGWPSPLRVLLPPPRQRKIQVGFWHLQPTPDTLTSVQKTPNSSPVECVKWPRYTDITSALYSMFSMTYIGLRKKPTTRPSVFPSPATDLGVALRDG